MIINLLFFLHLVHLCLKKTEIKNERGNENQKYKFYLISHWNHICNCAADFRLVWQQNYLNYYQLSSNGNCFRLVYLATMPPPLLYLSLKQETESKAVNPFPQNQDQTKKKGEQYSPERVMKRFRILKKDWGDMIEREKKLFRRGYGKGKYFSS